MPLVRVSQSLYDKIKRIMEKTGWTMRYILDKITENVDSEDFSSVEVEVIVKIREAKD